MPAPRISIVTVSLNQVGRIRTTLDSVLEQRDEIQDGSDAIEYVVIDGGSTDGTRDIIASYADRLTYWVSEPDRGQSQALNKGFARTSGDVLGWLNADDLLLPGALARVREAFAQGDCDVLCGRCRYTYPDGRVHVERVAPRDIEMLSVYDPIHQPSCFWRRQWHERVGGLDENLHFGMDWDFFLRMARAGARFQTVDDVLSVYRMTGTNKTSIGGEARNRELYELLRRHNGQGAARILTELAFRLFWPLKRLRRRRPQWLCRPLSDSARTTALLLFGPLLGFDRVRRCTHPFC